MRRFLAKTRAGRPAGRAAAVVAGLAVAALASGCMVNSPVQTNEPYVPADGVPATVGKLAVRDLVLVGDGKGEAVVSGSAINLGTDPVTMELMTQPSADGASSGGSQVELAPREQVDLSKKGLQLSDVTGKPGTLVPVMITSSTGGTTIVRVPLLPAVGYYGTVTPAPVASTGATPSETPSTPAATETTAATPTATATTTAG